MRISAAGNDMYICQICGRDLDSVKHPPVWRTDLTKSKSAGNVCPDCLHCIENKNQMTVDELNECRLDQLDADDGKLEPEMERDRR